MSHLILVAGFFVLLAAEKSTGQVGAERRILREYVPPDAIVSMGRTLSFDRAIESLNELSKRFTGKIIISPVRREDPIGIHIEAKHWQDALEMILRHHNLWYEERRDHFLIVAESGIPSPQVVVQRVSEVLDRPTLKTREINISAVFFEVNHDKVRESGINWNFFRSDADFGEIEIGFQGAGGLRRGDMVLDAGVKPVWSFANLTALMQLFESTGIGEVIASPEITVRSGRRGRIQIGEDISIKQRDFSGNITEVFISTGTIIDVLPEVIEEDGVSFIYLDVSVERSTGTPGVISTIISKAEAETQVLLLDGEETVIGGLYITDQNKLREGIPLLKDLPRWVFGLRYVFGYNRTAVTKQEVIILMRATLVPTLEERILLTRERNPLLQRRQQYQQQLERLQEK